MGRFGLQAAAPISLRLPVKLAQRRDRHQRAAAGGGASDNTFNSGAGSAGGNGEAKLGASAM